ncbi:hypothetical protein HDU88_004786 [Geranomyces variabilis]|nr:hypothetical protein HDU88_004786 [Geranomyces variabilis]
MRRPFSASTNLDLRQTEQVNGYLAKAREFYAKHPNPAIPGHYQTGAFSVIIQALRTRDSNRDCESPLEHHEAALRQVGRVYKQAEVNRRNMLICADQLVARITKTVSEKLSITLSHSQKKKKIWAHIAEHYYYGFGSEKELKAISMKGSLHSGRSVYKRHLPVHFPPFINLTPIINRLHVGKVVFTYACLLRDGGVVRQPAHHPHLRLAHDWEMQEGFGSHSLGDKAGGGRHGVRQSVVADVTVKPPPQDGKMPHLRPARDWEMQEGCGSRSLGDKAGGGRHGVRICNGRRGEPPQPSPHVTAADPGMDDAAAGTPPAVAKCTPSLRASPMKGDFCSMALWVAPGVLFGPRTSAGLLPPAAPAPAPAAPSPRSPPHPAAAAAGAGVVPFLG